MKYPIVIALSIVILFLISGCSTSIENATIQQSADNTISVQGSAKTSSIPDKAELHIAIETQGLTAEDAKTLNSQTSENVLDALKKVGIKKSDIETASFNLNPNYNYRELSNNPKITGYTATHRLKIETTNLDNVGSFIDAAVNAGANRVDSIQFSLTDNARAQVYKKVLGSAAQDAEAKAIALAEALQLTIKGVKSVSTSYDYAPRYVAMDEGMAFAAKTEILPTDVEVSATVNVVYEIN